MLVTVFGASGATGQLVVERALSEGDEVRAFVRTPAKLRARDPKLSVIEGNVADGPAVAAALTGCDGVICTLGVGRPLQHDQAVIDGVGHILGGMTAARVSRLIYLGFTGVDDKGLAGLVIRPIVHRLLRHEIADHVVKERMIRASSLDWTILHAPKLNNGRATGSYRVGVALPRRSLFPIVSRADVSACLVAQLTSRDTVRQVIDIQP